MPDESLRVLSRVDSTALQAYLWRPAHAARAVMVVAHGAAEHALRYERFARALNQAGIEVLAMDHRGHGQSPGPDGLGDFGAGGWDGLVADLGQFIEAAQQMHPELPVALFGHSMGAAAAQQYAPDGSHAIAALILSGTSARELPRAGERPERPARNPALESGRTPYDWLSRDPDEVDKYIADPLCGFGSWRVRPRGMMGDPNRLSNPELLRRIRPDLPCLFVAGDQDPVNQRLQGLRLLEQSWRDAGVQRIDTLYYPGGRHEMLNEINRDEVTRDIVAWLRGVLGV
jgi:alpha-beta hydrolase superfamily lysophospholipase